MTLELSEMSPAGSLATSVRALPLGRTEPRLWTPPLRPLTPETSYGYDVIDFARDVLHRPLDPWQQFAVIHAGELLEDGSPRFRKILILVARQNGKTELLVILSAYWMFVEAVPLILGTSTKLAYAKESWNKMMRLVERTPQLDELRNMKKWSRTAAGEEECYTVDGSRYKIAASNEEGGRSLTIHRLVLDELRQHKSYEAWGAAVPAGNAVDDFQVWAISNAGTDSSVVLNDLRDSAIKAIDDGDSDTDLCMMEWSAPYGADPLNVEALAQANPNLGRRIKHKSLLDDAKKAIQLGGDALSTFKTENMCIHVKNMDGAVNPFAWEAGFVEGDFSQLKSRTAFCIDLSPNRHHATVVAAAVLPDDRVRVQVVNSWRGEKAVDQLRRELPNLINRLRPKTVGYIPNGPAAALVADFRQRKGRHGWPPPGVNVVEITDEVAAVCMGFAEQVDAGQIVHNNDPLLNDHVIGAEKLWTGDRWRFSRRGEGECDAAYATAGAVHLARTLPAPVGKPRLLIAE